MPHEAIAQAVAERCAGLHRHQLCGVAAYLAAKARDIGDPTDAAEAGAAQGVFLGKRKEVMG